MPIIQSAKKKVRKDRKKTAINKRYTSTIAMLTRKLKTAQGTQKKTLSDKLYSALDKAAKKGVIEKKKASRIKSKFAKLLSNKKKASQ